MQPGTRVRLIQETAEQLARLSVADRDLTLRQFGVETPFSEAAPYAYAIGRLEPLDDAVLLGLHAHCHPTTVEHEASDPTAGPWEPERFRLFCSHTHHHARELGDLKAQLADQSINAFVAHADIEPTDAWQGVIESALDTCDALAAFLTEHFHGSKWADQEAGWTMGRGVLVIPIKLDTDPYGFLGQWQALPGLANGLAESIYRTLLSHELTRHRMAEVLVARFRRTGSFDQARANMRRLEAIPTYAWTDELLEAMQNAVEENGELQGAWYGYGMVSDGVENVLNKVHHARAS